MNSLSVRAGTAGWIARAKAETTKFEIGSSSLSGSYSGRLLRIASVIWVLEPPRRMVEPSGRARATAAAPGDLPPPPWFSTTTGAKHRLHLPRPGAPDSVVPAARREGNHEPDRTVRIFGLSDGGLQRQRPRRQRGGAQGE